VREALLNGGNISLALGYLRWRREKYRKTMQQVPSEEETISHLPLTFEQFKNVGYCLVYQAVCQDQVGMNNKIHEIK
jgi:hypothetical protein